MRALGGSAVPRRGQQSNSRQKGVLKTPIAISIDISLHVIAADVQKAPLAFFQNKAGESAGRIRARVNSDPIRANLWDY